MHHLTVDPVLNRKDYSFRLPVDRFVVLITKLPESGRHQKTSNSFKHYKYSNLRIVFIFLTL